MQDGCDRSVRTVRRVNVFADSHHFDIRNRHIDLRGINETVVIRINLSSTGPKPRPAQQGCSVIYHLRLCGAVRQPTWPTRAGASEFEAETSSFKRWPSTYPMASKRGKLVDHRIVKAGASHFKKIRNTTAKNATGPSRKERPRQGKGRVLRRAPISHGARFERPPGSGNGGRGNQVHPAPPQARRCIRHSAAPRLSEYTNMLTKWLTCIVFVPNCLLKRKRYTSHDALWLKIFG